MSHFLAAALLALVPPAQAPANDAAPTADSLRRDVAALANDAMLGRDHASGGLELAAAYLADRFKAIGLEPPPGAKTYDRPFSLARVQIDQAASGLAWGDVQIPWGASWSTPRPADGVWSGPAVFLGPDVDLSSSPAPDLRGRIVITPDRPGGQSTVNARQARRAGAKALVTIARGAAGSPRGRAGATGERTWPVEAIAAPPEFLELRIDEAAFLALYGEKFGTELLAHVDAAPCPGQVPLPGADLEIRASAPAHDPIAMRNLCGIVPGTDPALRDQFVIVSAHYDHIGVSADKTLPDQIFNGADDDASGVAGMLAIADMTVANPPARSVMFVAFAAEELGLMGSRAFVAAPPVPLDHITTVFNLEMLGRPAPGGGTGAWVTGFDRSTFGPLLRDAAARFDVAIGPDPFPGQNFFLRSDNASFAERGIVAHSISTFDPVVHHDYHGLSDEADRLDYEGFSKVVRGINAGVREVASGHVTPEWAKGDPLAPAAAK